MMLKPLPVVRQLHIETNHEKLARQLQQAHNNGELITINGFEFRSENFSLHLTHLGAKIRIDLQEVETL